MNGLSSEMLEACAIRRFQPTGKPVDNVAYVFMVEADARRHLHDLWLRGLEVRAMTGGQEARLDLDYQPTPPLPPAWVDGRTPDPSSVTTAQPVYDRAHDHAVVEALVVEDPKGYVQPEATPEVLGLVGQLEALRPGLHGLADRLHDDLGSDLRHDDAPPEVAASIAGFRELLCRTWRAAVPRRDRADSTALLRAGLADLRGLIS